MPPGRPVGAVSGGVAGSGGAISPKPIDAAAAAAAQMGAGSETRKKHRRRNYQGRPHSPFADASS